MARRAKNAGRETSFRASKALASDLPRIPRSFAAQAESYRLLECVVDPWPVSRCGQNDFGIDAYIEISSQLIGTDDSEATGHLFAVQLKSTDNLEEPEALRVSTGHLRYWLNHSLPVLLVSAHLPSRSLRCRWIDDALQLELRNRAPAFWSQDTVTVPLVDRLDRNRLNDIKVVVARFRARERAIHPRRFFDLQRRVLGAAERLQSIAQMSGIESATAVVTQARSEMRATEYMVAIAGPQRVGKSTLVNALLGLDVSPVADYPTTAVPLLFESGAEAEAVILMDDGTKTSVEATANSLRPFAAQQENESDTKCVRLIHVALPNEMLARGLCLVDTPGLHDASLSVRNVTERALETSDAVLYILDASLGAKFKLGQAEVDDLATLQSAKERVILVLNQSDSLDAVRRASLSEYVENQLKKYGIWDSLPVKPLFLSGLLAWEARSNGRPPPTEFCELEDQLWGHLLRNRSTGLHRLLGASRRLIEGCDLTEAFLVERTEKGSESQSLQSASSVCEIVQKQVFELAGYWQRKRDEEVGAYLAAVTQARVSTLASELEHIPSQGPYPTAVVLRKRLEQEILVDARSLWDYVQDQISQLSTQLGTLVQGALKETRTALGLPASVPMVIQLPHTIPVIDESLPEAGVGFLSGLFGFLVNPLFGIYATFVGLLVGHNVALGRRRIRVIGDIKKRYHDALQAAYGHLCTQAHERSVAAGHSLLAQANGRLETFINDAQRRIERLGLPLLPDESRQLQQVTSGIADLRNVLNGLENELTYVADRTPVDTVTTREPAVP